MADAPHSRRLRPEEWAALVNAVVVLLMPAALATSSWLDARSWEGATARVPTALEVWLRLPLMIGLTAIPFAPLVLVVGWRTFVHATRVLRDRDRGWRGVLEAGAVGLFIPLFLSIRPALQRPAEAAAFVFGYGVIGAGIGLALGCLFRLVALAVLRISAR